MISSLTAENLACVRGDRRLFESLHFRVRAGQALAVEGANGAGKTSLLRLIAGFLSPVAGRRAGQDRKRRDSDDAEERGRLVGWLGHQDGLKPQLTRRASSWPSLPRLYGASARSCRVWRRWVWRARPICPAAIFPPASGGVWRWPGC